MIVQSDQPFHSLLQLPDDLLGLGELNLVVVVLVLVRLCHPPVQHPLQGQLGPHPSHEVWDPGDPLGEVPVEGGDVRGEVELLRLELDPARGGVASVNGKTRS